MSESKSNGLAWLGGITALIIALTGFLEINQQLISNIFSSDGNEPTVVDTTQNSPNGTDGETPPPHPDDTIIVPPPPPDHTVIKTTTLKWSTDPGFGCSGVDKSGGRLTKNTSSEKWDAGCISQNYIPQGKAGQVKYVIKEIEGNVLFGLSKMNTSSNFEDVDFSIALNYIKKGTDCEVNIFKSGEYKGKKGTGYIGNEIVMRKDVSGLITVFHVTPVGRKEIASYQTSGDLYLDTSIGSSGASIGPFILSGDWYVQTSR